MIESLFSPCENPCPGCPAQQRLGRKAAVAASRAKASAELIGLNAQQRDKSTDLVFSTSSLLTDEGVMGQEWVDGLEAKGMNIPTYEDVQRYAKEAIDGDNELVQHLQALDDISAKMAENAGTCNGVKRYGLGPVAVYRCTSENVPTVQQFGVSDI